MLDTSGLESRRELAKSGRRERIVDATWELLREIGIDAVSMTLIAERAEVSPATVYNLFGKKSAVLKHVFDRDLTDFERLVEKARARDSLDRIFKAIGIAASLYRADPGFYRAMMHGRGRSDALYSAVSEPRIAFWQKMVAHACDDGHLRAGTDAEILGVTLSQIARGAYCEWVAERIGAERLETETSYGFAIALLAHATRKAAERLRAEVERLATSLTSRGRSERQA